jgi:tRNA A-37 threonylcarbamoyl transferase component Bud32
MSLSATDCLTEEVVLAYFGGRLGPEEVKRLEAHVDTCAHCRALVDASFVSTNAEAPAARKASSRRFAVGDEIAGRYRVERLLGVGGMGEVYEVHDRTLDERVALKTVRGEMADQATVLARFRREAQLARKVTHPNVCRVFDVGHHLTPEGVVTLFMTMALVDGESLGVRLRRQGPLPLAEALPLAEQMAAALQAAHAEGVIHRDFKSDNVLLVTRDGKRSAVVTDFGLARSRDDASLTRAGFVVGTPEYMAPEQAEKGEASVATDVYALGVVLYEMVTGRLPFKPGSSETSEPPPSPREIRRDVDRIWDAVIQRCLDRDPLRRFASPMAVSVALRGPVRRRWQMMGAAGLVVAALLSLVLARTLRPGAPTGRSPVVVVCLGDAPSATNSALEYLIASGLTAGDRARAVSHSRTACARADLSIGDCARLDDGARARLRRHLGADLVVNGSFTVASGGAVRLELALDGGAPTTALGSDGQLPALAATAVKPLRARLGLPALSSEESATLTAAWPSTSAAAESYAAALSRMDHFDAHGARVLLERAAASEPTHPQIHAALARALASLGYDKKAHDEAALALAQAGSQGPRHRLALELLEARLARDWDRAIAIGQQLTRATPYDAEPWLALASLEYDAKRGSDALAAVSESRSRLPPDDPRPDLLEAQARSRIDDFAGLATIAERARQRALARGDRHVAAQALYWQARARYEQGQLEPGAALAEAAEAELSATGDERQATRAARLRALLVEEAGDVQRAENLFEAVLARFSAGDQQDGVTDTLFDRTRLLRRLGRLAEAKHTNEKAQALQREIGSQSVSAFLNGLGEILFDEGDLVGARGLFEQALQHRRQGPRLARATSLVDLAETLYELQDARARDRLHDAIDILRPLPRPAELGRADALDARLLLDVGDAVAAETAAARAATELRAAHLADAAECADALRALALIVQDKREPARSVAAQLPSPSSPLAGDRIAASIAVGRVRAATTLDGAGQLVEEARADAAHLGLVGMELDAELALAEIELNAGHKAQAGAHVKDALARAKALGCARRQHAAALLAERIR